LSSYRPLVVLTTASSPEEASRIATHVVEARLAACVNVIDRVQSVYRWQDAVESATEVLLIIKTSDSNVDALEAAIREMHSYQVPEILALPVSSGSDDYLRWLVQSLE
jgi:periplasmic divalent cation tolerance protein